VVGATPHPGAARGPSAEWLSALDALTGPAWVALEAGTASVLTFAWAVPGRTLTSERLEFDAEGNPAAHERGVYSWDPMREQWTVSFDGTGGKLLGVATLEDGGMVHRLRSDRDGRGNAAVASPASFAVRAVADTLVTWTLEAPSTPSAVGSPRRYVRPGAADARSAAAEERAYVARAGGRWHADNQASPEEPGAPTGFGYRAEQADDMLRLSILVDLPDGRQYTAWRIVSSFDSGSGVNRMHQVGVGGALLEGRLDHLPDGRALLRMRGSMADGQTLDFMDVSVRRGPDTFHSRSWVLVEDVWTPTMTSEWRRVPAG
jgi:hypothetical protein